MNIPRSAMPPWMLGLLGLGAAWVHGQGGSAVIALVMPPPGGEGYSILQSGGMFAEGATAAYYNPALLADLERQTGSQVHYSNSRQDLLPVLGLPGLYHAYWGAAAVAPDAEGGTDMGVGFFRTHVSFGRNQATDEQGNLLSTFDSFEDIYGLSLGLRLGGPVSVGVSAKFIDSHLADGSGGAAPARSFAFDAGLLVNPRLTLPASLRLPRLELMPSFSLALANMGPDVFYAEPHQADPIPLTLSAGGGVHIRLLDFFEFAAAHVRDREVHRRTGWSDEPVMNSGVSLAAGFYRYSTGWLKDESGLRDEHHTGHALEFNLLRLLRFMDRLRKGDFESPSPAFDARFPFPPVVVLGLPYRANPRISMGTREIESRGGGIRQGQRAYFVGFSI